MGILLVLVSVAGVVFLVNSADRTTEVYAARDGIGVGEALTAENVVRAKVRLGETEQHYIPVESGLPRAWLPCSGSPRTSWYPGRALGRWTSWTANQ
jgi:hypothetical protein